MDASPRYLVLGPVLVERAGELREPSAKKQRLLLTRLLLAPNEVVSVDQLFDALWGDRPPATARKLVQLYVHSLRGMLGEAAIETASDGYRVLVSPDALDCIVFERLADEGRRLLGVGNPELARTTLGRALGLWRGPAYGDAAYESFARVEAERLEELRLDCLEARVAADLQSGVADAAEIQSLVADHPEREGLRAQLMLALYRAGRQTDALAAYDEGRAYLDEQLGLEPESQLRDLQRRILNHDPELDAPPRQDSSAQTLPVAVTPLLGREQELARLSGVLERPEVRLLSIVGAGGIGKSRVALELARRFAHRFANGAYLVELAETRDGRHAPSTLLRAVGGSEQPGSTPADALARFLGEREVLLVLDNVEHLPTIGDEVIALLRRCPRVSIVATSRRVLHLTGEHVYPLPPLDRESAIELFRVRAASATHEAVGRLGEDREIGEICRRLDDLPLAIELAASRMVTLTPLALLKRLDDRLGLLIDGPRDLPDRQRTLRETLHWSGDLLSGSERNGLAGLGVFVGGCLFDAAEAVAGVGLEQLHTLVAHSLVNRTTVGDQPRFGLHETVREYALELLGKSRSDVERRHAFYFADLAWQYFCYLIGPEYREGARQQAWLRRLDDDAANLQAAYAWSMTAGDATLALRLAAGLWRYRWVRGQLAEGLDEIERALEIDDRSDATLTARALAGGAGLAWGLGRHDRAKALATGALERAPHDLTSMLSAENVLGLVASREGDYSAARSHLEQMRELALELESTAEAMTAVMNLGDVAYAQGDYKTATSHWLECLAHWRERGNDEGVGLASHNLGLVALRSDQLDEARDSFRQALACFESINFREQIAYTLLAQAALAARSGDSYRACLLLGAAHGILDEVGSAQQGVDRALADETEAVLRAALGRAAFENAVATGRQQGLALADR